MKQIGTEALSSMMPLIAKGPGCKGRVAKINPAVNVTPYIKRLTKDNAEEIFFGSRVVIDALDNIPDRFLLEIAAKKMGIPLVHWAVAGFIGQVMAVFPDDAGMENIYDKNRGPIPLEKNPA
jgi:molybdopterin/thiamine biosynthesis adenylyltransferase